MSPADDGSDGGSSALVSAPAAGRRKGPLDAGRARTLLDAIIAAGRVTFTGRVLNLKARVDLGEIMSVLKQGEVEAPTWRLGRWQYLVRANGKSAVVVLRLGRPLRGPRPRRPARDEVRDLAQPTAAVEAWEVASSRGPRRRGPA